MNRVTDLNVVDDYTVWLKFDDNEERTINLKPYLGKGFTSDLLDTEKFNKVFIEPGGGIAWENGYDFCPNFLKQLAEEPSSV